MVKAVGPKKPMEFFIKEMACEEFEEDERLLTLHSEKLRL